MGPADGEGDSGHHGEPAGEPAGEPDDDEPDDGEPDDGEPDAGFADEGGESSEGGEEDPHVTDLVDLVAAARGCCEEYSDGETLVLGGYVARHSDVDGEEASGLSDESSSDDEAEVPNAPADSRGFVVNGLNLMDFAAVPPLPPTPPSGGEEVEGPAPSYVTPAKRHAAPADPKSTLNSRKVERNPAADDSW